MPKARVTKNETAPVSSNPSANRTPVKINSAGTPMWYKVIMFAFMIVGLAWLIINYLVVRAITTGEITGIVDAKQTATEIINIRRNASGESS